MKPILFNSEMVCAIWSGRKTQTRRVIKPQPPARPVIMPKGSCWPGYFAIPETPKVIRPPYQVNGILYVRETWARGYFDSTDCEGYNKHWFEENLHPDDGYLGALTSYLYRVDYEDKKQNELNIRWHPSVHMPKEAARIFLRVTDVRAERLQDIDSKDCVAEGIWNGSRRIFSELWDSTIKKADRDKYGWAANPWVWRIEFERMEEKQ